MGEDNHDTVRLLAPPPLIYVVFLFAGLVVNVFYPLALMPSSIAFPAGVIVVLFAVIIGASALQAMRRAGTSPLPSSPSKKLVVNGAFRFSRNPIYVSLTLMYVGITVALNASWPLPFLVAALIMVDRGVISREEKYLVKRFGEEYLGYKSRVRRWV